MAKKNTKKRPNAVLHSIPPKLYDEMKGGELFQVSRMILYKHFPHILSISLAEEKNKTLSSSSSYFPIPEPGKDYIKTHVGAIGYSHVSKENQLKYEWEMLHEGDILMFVSRKKNRLGDVYPLWLITSALDHSVCVRVIPILYGAYLMKKFEAD